MFSALLACSLLYGIIVWYIVRRERLALYHPLFLFGLWHLLFYLWVPWQIWLKGDWSSLLRYGVPLHSDYYLVKTLLLAHLGFLATVLGAYASFGWRWAARLRLPQLVIKPQVALGVMVIFLLLAAYSIRTYHGIPGVSQPLVDPMSRDEIGRTIFTGGSGYAYSSYNFLAGVGLLAAFLYPGQGWTWRLFTLGLILFYLGFAVLLGWHRASWVLFLLGLATIWLIFRRRRWPPLWWAPTVLVLFMVFNISATDRSAWRRVIEEYRPIQAYALRAQERVTEGLIKTDIGNFEFNTLQVALYPERVSYEGGRDYFNRWIVRLLPRVVFTDKDSYMLPTNLSRTNDIYHTVGPTTGLYFDFYCNFGILGVALGCFLFGLVLRTVWQALRLSLNQGPGHQYVVLIYVGLVAFFPQLLRDGLTSLFTGYFFILSPILLALVFSRKKAFLVVKNPRRWHAVKN